MKDAGASCINGRPTLAPVAAATGSRRECFKIMLPIAGSSVAPLVGGLRSFTKNTTDI
jgi:hypothetical protein